MEVRYTPAHARPRQSTTDLIIDHGAGRPTPALAGTQIDIGERQGDRTPPDFAAASVSAREALPRGAGSNPSIEGFNG